jgi:hypothetical protein
MIAGLLILVKCHEEAEAHVTYLDLKICFWEVYVPMTYFLVLYQNCTV